MKKINITESDIETVATRLAQIAPDIPSTVTEGPEWSNPPAVKVIDCVLSLNRNYDTFVVPRLKSFINKHPHTQRVVELANLIDSYPTPHAFVKQELTYNHEDRARILQSVVWYVCTIVEKAPIVSEEKVLKQWAIQAKPQHYRTLNIKGFALAGFQYLRMLFGAQTTKPDVYIIRFVSETLNRKVSDVESLLLLEAASERTSLSVRVVDNFIWKRGARQAKTIDIIAPNDDLHPEYNETLLKNGTRGKYAQQYTAGTNIVRLAPDVAAAFPNEEAVNAALRFALKVMDDAKQLARHCD